MSKELRKKLGKIKSIAFGYGGYQEQGIGLNITLGGESGWTVDDSETMWDANLVKHNDRTKWSEADRDKAYAKIVRYISDLLADAKVDSIDKLKGKPVEATFEGNLLKDWRILKEVL